MTYSKTILPYALSALLMVGLLTGNAHANTITKGLDPFDTLTVNTGVHVTLVCGDANQYTLASTIEPYVRINQQKTNVVSLAGQDIKNEAGQLNVTITTKNPLKSISLETGATVSVPACAVSKQASLKATTGADIYLSDGDYQTLTVNVSVGSNLKVGTNTTIGTMDLTATIGAKVNVCGALDVLKGKSAVGAKIGIPDNTNTHDFSSLMSTIKSPKC